MSDMNIITKGDFAEARTMDPKRLKALMDARIKIQDGPGADEEHNVEALEQGHMPKSLCIMEATAYILGYANITDSPPCTSTVIRNIMVDMNDNCVSDRKRAGMKNLIPEIINTAPTQWIKMGKYRRDPQTGEKVYDTKLVTKTSDPQYKAAEEKRRVIYDQFCSKFEDDEPKWEKITLPTFTELIMKLVAVAKFDKANIAADLVPSSEDPIVDETNPEQHD